MEKEQISRLVAERLEWLWLCFERLDSWHRQAAQWHAGWGALDDLLAALAAFECLRTVVLQQPARRQALQVSLTAGAGAPTPTTVFAHHARSELAMGSRHRVARVWLLMPIGAAAGHREWDGGGVSGRVRAGLGG